MSRYAKIKKYDIANGEGSRTSIYFTGCDIHCDGCFNKELQNPDYGIEYTDKSYSLIKKYTTIYVRGLSILGGEPLSKYNKTTVRELCEQFKKDFPDKTIYVWSGYTLDYLKSLNDYDINTILDIIDILVDGPFVQSKYDRRLTMRGSSNQNIINLK